MYQDKILVRQLGLQPYEPISQAMHEFTDTRDDSTLDEIWLVEHYPVFTQGQAGKAEHILMQVLYTEGQVGMPKSAAARERLAALSSHTAFECRPEGITPENARPILDGYDLILDCCDNFPTRYLLDDLCAACRKPWVHGSIGEFYGQVTVFNGRKGRRYRDLYPDRKALCARPRISQGVLGTVPGVIGTLQASEAIKYLCGFGEPLDGRLFTIDLRTLQTQIIDY